MQESTPCSLCKGVSIKNQMKVCVYYDPEALALELFTKQSQH